MDALLPAMLANTAVAVGLMAVAFGVAAMHRPRAAHAAWLVVLLKLVTPPLVVVPVVWFAATSIEEPVPRPVVSGPAPTVLPVAPVEDGMPEPAEVDPAEETPSVLLLPVETAAVVSDEPEPINPWRIATVVWLGGAAGWLGLVAWRVVRFRRFVRTSVPADAETVGLARTVAVRFGVKNLPDVRFVDAPVSPMLWAVVGRAKILLPQRLWLEFSPDHRETVLAHELAHLARCDHWMRRFELVVLALYWWCPVAWVAVRQLRRAEEACCDARVLGAVPGRAEAYANALVETIAFVNRPRWAPLTSGGVARASDLKRRVTMILNSTGGRGNPWLPGVVLLAGVAVLPLAPGLADEPKPARAAAASADDPPAVRGRIVEGQPLNIVRGQPIEIGVAEGVPLQSAPAAPTPWTTTAARPQAPANASLKDEIELLEAQMNVKQAHVRAAERGVKSAERTFAQIREAAGKGVASTSEVSKAEEAYDKAMSELEIRKAELQEHAVRVSQAKRRLTAGEATGRTRTAEWVRSAPAAVPVRPLGDTVPPTAGRPGTTTPAPARDPQPTPPYRAAPAEPGTRAVPKPASDSAADQRAALARKMNDVMDQYERTQAEIQKMQKLQADLKRTLEDLAAEQKKLSKDLPKPVSR